MEEERYILLEAAELLGVSKGALVRWINNDGLREVVDSQVMPHDKRAHYLTRTQLEKIAKDHRRTLTDYSRPRPESKRSTSSRLVIRAPDLTQLAPRDEDEREGLIRSIERLTKLLVDIQSSGRTDIKTGHLEAAIDSMEARLYGGERKERRK